MLPFVDATGTKELDYAVDCLTESAMTASQHWEVCMFLSRSSVSLSRPGTRRPNCRSQTERDCCGGRSCIATGGPTDRESGVDRLEVEPTTVRAAVHDRCEGRIVNRPDHTYGNRRAKVDCGVRLMPTAPATY